MEIGRALVALGLVLLLLGLVWLYAPGLLAWFGRLPGDIRIEREGFRFYFPLTSMLLVSLALSLLFNLLWRWFR
ncbi:DUF2905 domain-containing protein [Meiothermus ruber]|uniref:DUF2905 domain-containing protein n=1 Tax=Meiothermus ruber (strain ATCC 35948 / DSM 1279 / VKM B-1258 / 21) TaxID=504728 RepID=D3PTQ2_MEIRD|nr:DUF2905 domain-containing protein [Meiothermus ruber]ADD28835.1 conserved hypothetical protein [Meiothermus ruber DSM 1279]AGK05716.1 hypothetical protein K649_12130 [Meiothermus ruber DSM 1279]MCL6529411.1 DUF2905 domain-containing protein [Meiothermus ruber]GAO75749.1 putative uncharacterized protein [Meiothermus ruber H328]